MRPYLIKHVPVVVHLQGQTSELWIRLLTYPSQRVSQRECEYLCIYIFVLCARNVFMNKMFHRLRGLWKINEETSSVKTLENNDGNEIGKVGAAYEPPRWRLLAQSRRENTFGREKKQLLIWRIKKMSLIDITPVEPPRINTAFCVTSFVKFYV